MNKLIVFIIILSISIASSNKAGAEEVLIWQDCVREAAKNHPDLISAEEKVKQSQASERATASTLFPQITTDLNAARSKSGTTGSTADAFSYGVSGSQLLFDGAKTIYDVKAAKEDIQAAQYNFRFVSTDVRLRLRTAFVNLLRAQEALRITEEIYKIRRSNLVSVTLRYESGLEHKGSLLKAEADLAQADYEIVQAKRDVEVAQRQLTKEMGRDEFTPMSAKGDFEITNLSREKPDLESLVKDNPSLQNIMAQKNSAEFALKSSYANFFPTITGEAGAGKSSSRWPPENNQWNMGVVLSFPIFEGGLKFAQKDQSLAFLNQIKSDERSTRDALILALEQTWVDLQDSVDNLSVQKKFLEAAEARSNIADAQYSLGIINFDDWTIIEDDLVNKKRILLNAQAQVLLAEANWIYAKGETLEYAQE